MKKLLVLLMAMVMVFSLFACGEPEPTFEEQVVGMIPVFLEDEGQEFFATNMDKFEVVKGDAIPGVLQSKSIWNVEEKESYGRWTGKYEFEADGDIRETIYDGSVGYFNQKSWVVDGDNLIIKYVVSSGEKSDTCEMRKIDDSTYLLYRDGAPFGILK